MDDALRLADELADPEARLYAYQLTQAAAELRRLHAENETLKQSVARLQQHHATAWNRGHTMGMKANEDTARRALDAVKQDAWGNTQLTEALLKAEAQRDALLAEHQQTLALQQRSYEREIQLEVEAERERIGDQCAEQIKAAIEDEREACAALLEANGMRCGEESLSRLILETNAAAIRARGNT